MPVNNYGPESAKSLRKQLDSGVLVCEALRERSEQRTNKYPEVGGCVVASRGSLVPSGRSASAAPTDLVKAYPGRDLLPGLRQLPVKAPVLRLKTSHKPPEAA